MTVPNTPGYYRDFSGDIWRIEENRSWTLRPGEEGGMRRSQDYWRWEPFEAVEAPRGLPTVTYRVEGVKNGLGFMGFNSNTLEQAQKLIELYEDAHHTYRIARIETTSL